MKNQKDYRGFKKFFYAILQEFSEKFNINFMKKIADLFFAFSERIALNFDYFLDLYIKYYEDMVNEEINSVSISKSDKIVYVGCGSIPASSILISQKTGVPVLGIDKDKISVKKAKLCVDKLDLSDIIEIKNSEASDFLFDNFNVIIISHGVCPIDKFLKYLSKKVAKNSRIILRTFSDEDGNLLKSDEFVNDLFKINKIIKHEKQGRVISVILSLKS